jgi:cytoskeletal protein RodZ
LDQGSETEEHVSSATYFSNLLEDKDRRLKIELTLSLILLVNLRLGGYSIWSASLIAPHIKEDYYSGHKHLTASMQSRKYSDDIFKMKFRRTRRRL